MERTTGLRIYLRKSPQQNPKKTGGTKTRATEEILASDTTSTANSKYSLSLNQVTINIHTQTIIGHTA